MEKWKAVPNEVVRHAWQCQADDCEHNNPVAYVSPNFFQRNGNPVCECDQDMTYLYTEVVDSSEGEDGDLAFVETMDKDDIPELMEVKMTEKQFEVTIMRTESRNHTFIVQAEDQDQAEERAMEMSNDFDWKVSHSVHHADEQVVGVKEED